MEHMSGATAQCYQKSHAEGSSGAATCAVPSNDVTDVKICGFSCKDISNLSSNKKESNVTFVEGRGESGKTFQEFMDNLEAHGGKVVICENLDEISKVGSEIRAKIMREFAGRGWAANVTVVASKNHGSRTTRVRAYLVAVNHDAFNITKDEARGIIDNMFETQKELTVDLIPMDATILDAADSYVTWYNTLTCDEVKGSKQDWKEGFEQLLNKTTANPTWSDLSSVIMVDTTGTYKKLPEREQFTLALLTLKNPGRFRVRGVAARRP